MGIGVPGCKRDYVNANASGDMPGLFLIKNLPVLPGDVEFVGTIFITKKLRRFSHYDNWCHLIILTHGVVEENQAYCRFVDRHRIRHP